MNAKNFAGLLMAGTLGVVSLAFAQQGNSRRDQDSHDGQPGAHRVQRHDERHDLRSDARDLERAREQNRAAEACRQPAAADSRTIAGGAQRGCTPQANKP